MRQWVADQVGTSASAVDGAGAAVAGTQVFVGEEGVGLLGCMAFTDQLRPDSVSTVARLQDMGVRVLLMSGDGPEAVAQVAAECGIAPGDATGSMSPAAKEAAVAALRADGGTVAMVGDGINDAPALAAAHVGVALQGGMEVAGEVAGVVLMGDRLGQLLDALSLGRATLAKIKQNLAWALVYNVVGIPLAAGALLPSTGVSLDPSVAAGLMAGSSLAVVGNSVLLRSHFSRGAAAPEPHARDAPRAGGVL